MVHAFPPRTVEVYVRVNDDIQLIERKSYGTVAEQAADAVNITGGTLVGFPLTVQAGVSAAGTDETDATVLDGSEIVTVTTVASGTGVIFPVAVPGTSIFVFNAGANPLDVYPFLGGAIDEEATDAPRIIPVDFGFVFHAVTTTLWVSDHFGTLAEQAPASVNITGGTIVGVPLTVEAAVTAAGTNQATATLLDGSDITEVTVVATDEGVRLPPAVAGDVMFIYNADTGEAVDVYPAVGDFIDAAAVDVALVLGVDTGVTFHAQDGATWITDK